MCIHDLPIWRHIAVACAIDRLIASHAERADASEVLDNSVPDAAHSQLFIEAAQ